MSLESAIEHLATAIDRFTDAFTGNVATIDPATLPLHTAQAEKAAALKPEKPAEAAKPKAEKKKAEPKNEPETEPTVTREHVAKQIIAVVKAKGRDVAVGVLQGLGYEKLPDCPDEKLAELNTALINAAN